MTSPLQIAIVGLGNVGTGVARILTEHPDRITQRSGRPIHIKRAVVRDLKKPRDVKLNHGVLTDDLSSVVKDPNIQVAVELMGGIHPAREVVLELLEAGKSRQTRPYCANMVTRSLPQPNDWAGPSVLKRPWPAESPLSLPLVNRWQATRSLASRPS
jgi:hypothetical protein